MAKEQFHELPGKCPITGESLYISELTSAETGVVIRGKFKLPKIAQLDVENARILEVFVRSRGVISTMEKELGLSYPTVRSRIDVLLHSLGYEPLKTPPTPPPSRDEDKAEARKRILDQLEAGEISAAEAKEKMKEVGTK